VFSEDDVSVLQLAADRAALAIDNARLSEQRSVTEIMQRTLLPDALPDVPGLSFSAKYLPAGSGVKIGGDWYDVLQLADGRLALVIGDVVGRGVLAASVMAEIRTALRAYLTEGHELSKVMTLLNELLVSMGRNRSATAAILELDLERGEMEAVSAGHLPGLLMTPDGRAGFLEQLHGLPLGISAGQEYVPQLYSFPEGSALLLYTDGLVERRGVSIDDGMTHAADLVQDGRARSLDILADELMSRLEPTGGYLDDVAILLYRQPGPFEMQFTADAAQLAPSRSALRSWLTKAGVDPDQIVDVLIASGEAVANAIEHGHRDHPDGTVSLYATAHVDGLHLSVVDTGTWKEPRNVPEDNRGRGIALMRGLMQDLAIHSGDTGTTVHMYARIT
jgi:anti-sigma regulatory factor (Ser/Thr protein kinase)